MKKAFCIILCTVIIFILSGCNFSDAKNETDEEIIVSSIGFDEIKDEVYVYAEAIINKGKESESSTKLLKAKGETVEEAIYNLSFYAFKPLYLNHCGLLVIGEKLSSKNLKGIWKYLFNNKNITQAIEVVCTENSEKLLTLIPENEIAIGYEISYALSQISKNTGIEYRNRFYEIESARNEQINSYAVPFIKISDKKPIIDGLQLYLKDEKVLKTEQNETVLYSIIKENYDKGYILISGKKYKIDVLSVNYKFNYSNVLSVDITVKLKDVNVNNLKNQFENFSFYKKDLYGIGERIYKKDKKIWNKIKNNYDSIFEKSRINILVKA